MSNARVTPNMKVQGSNVRRAPAGCDTLNMWSGPHAFSLGDRSQQLSLPPKVVPGMPLLRLNRVIAFVDANIAVDLCVSTLAAVAGMSPFYFCRSFKQSTGITPHRYVLQRRMEQAKRLLAQKSTHLLQIAHEVGFADQSQFTRVFHKMVGITPTQYRKESIQQSALSPRHAGISDIQPRKHSAVGK